MSAPRTVYIASRSGYALRHGDWKLVQPADAQTQLFNLAIDPFETTDRSQIDSQRTAELRALLAEEQARDQSELPADLADVPK